MYVNEKNKVVFDPYSSTTLSGVDTGKIMKSLDSYYNDSDVEWESLCVGTRTIPTRPDWANYIIAPHLRVPSFNHPIRNKWTRDISIDLRTYTSFDKVERKIMIKDLSLFKIDQIRSTFIHLTPELSAEEFLSFSKLPAVIYATAIANMITMRNPLEADALQNIMALALMFYVNRFYPYSVWDDEDTARQMAKKYATALRINPSVIIEFADKKIPLNSLSDLAKAIGEHSNSLRLENITAGSLILMSRSLWYGPNAADMIAVGLDDPSTFMALCYAACEEFNYRKTKIGAIAAMYKSDIPEYSKYIKSQCIYSLV